MTHTRFRLLLAALLVTSAAGSAGIVAAAGVSVADVQVTPSAPAPGEAVRFDVTVENTGNADYEIDAVALRTYEPFDELTRVEYLGTLIEGGSMTIPLTYRFDDPGVKNLRVVVYGQINNEPVQRRFPITLTVRNGGPQVLVESGDLTEGVESAVNVTVSNGESEAVNNVEVTLRGEGVDVDRPRRVVTALDAGTQQTFAFPVTPTTAGETSLEAVVRYTTTNGEHRVVTQRLPVSPTDLREDVAVTARVTGDARPAVDAEVANFGNAPLTDVTLVARVDGEVVARESVADVAPEGASEATLNLSSRDDAAVEVVARYTTAGTSGTAATTVDYAANPGAIELTGVDLEREGGAVHVSGSASNVGLSAAEGVLVRVLPAEGVDPARPYREFFVGRVPASDFVSFDLYASVDANVSAIPVEVSYIVDGERRTEVTNVPMDLDDPADSADDAGGQPVDPLILGLGVVVAVGVLALMGYAVRNSGR
ncbi:hypothetical protein [Halobaculum marinum]|uniref:CARDB protein n=1 Tax=Halobaculum marinum TaxID=3031996 RepID=A0ABD5WXK4_9EURY|nr:hypothetical protein [Halobaculum sp. DT55]